MMSRTALAALAAIGVSTAAVVVIALGSASGPHTPPAAGEGATAPVEAAGASPTGAAPAPSDRAGPRAPGAAEDRGGPPIRWRRSLAVGDPEAGRLVRGVRLPAEGRDFFSWDPVRRAAPNRVWRRWGADTTIRTTLRVLRAHRAANPGAERVGIGDISRPRGGDFGARYGAPGHFSHQNGLDVDLYYPRRDRSERAPLGAAQIIPGLSQQLVDRFVAAGAVTVFVGPNTGLRGPPGVVRPAAGHDNHLHVRFPAQPAK